MRKRRMHMGCPPNRPARPTPASPQAAARSYYLLVAPEAARSALAADQQVLGATAPGANPARAYKAVRAGLQAIAKEAGIDYEGLVQRC